MRAGRNLRRGLALLLVALLFACGRGGGCAGPRRHAGGEHARRARDRQAPQPAVSPQADDGARSASPPRRQRKAEAEGEGAVIRVRDGDSIVVQQGGVDIEVRLDGIDCPELAQAYGRMAKGFTSDLALRRQVRLAANGKDKYDRVLAEVVLPDGRSLNRELVAAGYAWWFRRYSTDRSLEALEQEARTARRGLWADANPVPPWDFRAAERR